MSTAGLLIHCTSFNPALFSFCVMSYEVALYVPMLAMSCFPDVLPRVKTKAFHHNKEVKNNRCSFSPS